MFKTEAERERSSVRRSIFMEGDFSTSRLMAAAGPSTVTQYQIEPDRIDPTQTVMRGRLSDVQAPSGLFIHATDMTEKLDLAKQWTMQPSFMVAVVLEGGLDMQLDDQALRLGGRGEPVGQFWNLTRPTNMQRRSLHDTHMRKVIIRVPPKWLWTVLEADYERDDPRCLPFTQHRATGVWRPSRHVVALAEQLINPPPDRSSLRVLAAESRALEIVREALASAIEGADPPALRVSTMNDCCPSPTSVDAERAQRIRTFIVKNRNGPLSLPAIAAQLGMSVGSMQTSFKRTYRITIGAFIREQRLIDARDLIERHGKQVGEAAYLAGYENLGSFSTAFKRAFGFSPSDCKQ